MDTANTVCCLLHCRCESTVSELGVLVNRPLTNYKKATEKLREHFVSKGRKSHQAAMERAVMENHTVAIDQQLSLKRAQLITLNRRKLKSIAATVIFCGGQSIAFRGHHDDGMDVLDDSSGRHGDF